MKNRFHYEDALDVAVYLHQRLEPSCQRINIVGSVRRGMPQVGDAKLLYISKPGPVDMFGEPIGADAATAAIDKLVEGGVLAQRMNRAGHVSSWGEVNKHAVYLPGGADRPPYPHPVGCGMSPFAVDLFAATPENWVCLLVCRTGPRDAVTAICQRAQACGYHYQPYDGLRPHGTTRQVLHPASEQEFFDLLKWPCLPPEKRHLLVYMADAPL